MLDVHHFKAPVEGKHILFLGAIHGDEICGPEAINKIIQQINSKELTLKQGQVTFVPVSNPLAYAKNVRQVNENLNRIIEHHSKETIPEHSYANQVVEVIQQADILVDLHSFDDEGDPFLFLDHPTPTMQSLADILGGKMILYGWDNIYEKTSTPSYCTEWCAFQHNTESLTFECGSNGSEESIQNAYTAIIKTLSYFDMIDHQELVSEPSHHVEMKKLYIKEQDGDFVQEFKTITSMTAGDVIAIYNDGTQITMPFDGFLILPKHWAQIGDEWFYIATTLEHKEA